MTDTTKPPEKFYAIFVQNEDNLNIRKWAERPFEGATEYEIVKPLADYPEDELQAGIKSLQAEIDRRKAQDEEITALARKVCADIYNYPGSGLETEFTIGNRDDELVMRLARAAVIAGMGLKGNKT